MQGADCDTAFRHRHLLGIEGLSPAEIEQFLDLADGYVELNRQAEKKRSLLRGRTIINCFFENSTRTRTSFEVAGKRLGADVINMAVAVSSMVKGETLIDTAMTLNAMHPDVLVVRHPESGAVQLLSEKVDCAVINAGDGSHEHPTQALLDALTIRRRKGRLGGLTVAICGDVLHSRVARSNIALLNTMGARVRVVAPRTLLPAAIERLGVEVFHDMADGLADVDIVMMLRLQSERMHGSFVPSTPRIFSFLRARLRQAARRQARRADHASRPDEPRRRDRQRGRRRHRPQPDPPSGRDGGRGPHGLPRDPGPRSRQRPALAVSERAAVAAGAARTLIRGARLLDPASGLDAIGDLLIEGERIAAVGGIIAASDARDGRWPRGCAWPPVSSTCACNCASPAPSTWN